MTSKGDAVAIGSVGTILRSTDHGASWIPVPSPSPNTLLAIWNQGDVLWASASGTGRSCSRPTRGPPGSA